MRSTRRSRLKNERCLIRPTGPIDSCCLPYTISTANERIPRVLRPRGDGPRNVGVFPKLTAFSKLLYNFAIVTSIYILLNGLGLSEHISRHYKRQESFTRTVRGRTKRQPT